MSAYKPTFSDFVTTIKLDKDSRNKEDWLTEFNLRTKYFGDLNAVIKGTMTLTEFTNNRVQRRVNPPRRNANNAEAANQEENNSNAMYTLREFEALKGDYIRAIISPVLFKDVTRNDNYSNMENSNDFVGIYKLVMETYQLSHEESFDETMLYMNKILKMEFNENTNIDNMFNEMHDFTKRANINIPDPLLSFICINLWFYTDSIKNENIKEMYKFCKELVVDHLKQNKQLKLDELRPLIKSYYKQITRKIKTIIRMITLLILI